MKGTWLRIVVLLVFVGGLAVAGGWWMMRGQVGEVPPPPPKSAATHPTDDADAPSHMPIHAADSLVLPSVLEPFEAIPVSAKLSASIASLLVRDGVQVMKGQTLCVLDDVEIRRQIDQARLMVMQAQEQLRSARQRRALDAGTKRLMLAQAQRELADYTAQCALDLAKAQTAVRRAEREVSEAQALYEAKAVSAEDVRLKREALEDTQRALAALQTSQAAGLAAREKSLAQVRLDAGTEAVSAQDIAGFQLSVRNAASERAERQRRLADTRVVAPIGGTVRIIPRTRSSSMTATGQSAEVLGPGVRVFEGDPFLEIATTERACCKIDVDETDIARLHIGMKAKISGDAFNGKELEGEVATIQTSGRKAGEGVSLFPVTILVTSPLNGARMGMTADVSIDLRRLQ